MIPALGTAIETCRVTAGGAAAFSFDRLVVSCLVVLLVMYVVRQWSMGLDDDGLLDDGATLPPDLDDVEEDSESLRAELEEIAEIDDAVMADREERFKNDLGEVAVAGIIVALVTVSLGLFAVISYGYGDKVALAGTQTQDSTSSFNSLTEDFKNVAEFTNGIVGCKG